MAKKRARSSHWLNNRFGRLTLGDWIALVLFFVGVVLIFCLFFIRRHTLPYHFEHTFAVHDPEFVGSALALADPVLVPGNKIDILNNGDEYFPAMLAAIGAARRTINFEAFILYSDEVGLKFRDAFCDRARAGVEVRVLVDNVGSGSALKRSDVRMMKQVGREMESIFEKDRAQSREYTLDEFKKRSLWERVTEWLAIPFRSQL